MEQTFEVLILNDSAIFETVKEAVHCIADCYEKNIPAIAIYKGTQEVLASTHGELAVLCMWKNIRRSLHGAIATT